MRSSPSLFRLGLEADISLSVGLEVKILVSVSISTREFGLDNGFGFEDSVSFNTTGGKRAAENLLR